ncbi:aldo/keto reductase [Mycolicibacterium sp. 050158]|uniref:aldo/keto reductase n=1 Tax=Mycolicibacterium sp. 050158 TaxID=3090602 RepID=UPI00299D99FD|nr:aldo/keto reductase [Mycolicibacterium sp. 050158]MDX1888614.1 aldo/keto reductase [Mycolicibacterium sp. 050158]
MTPVPEITLNDGARIPQLGFGVYKVAPDETAVAVRTALEVGYRHLDTAAMYHNEEGVGRGLRDAGIDRRDVFITSKLDNGFHEPDAARRAFDDTLTAIGSNYVDLYLIHWPLPTRYGGDFVSTWQTLEEFAADGRARSIGVSNFHVPHLRRLAAETATVPAVNQVEAHPFFTNATVRDYCTHNGIAFQAWSPLARGKVLGDPVIQRMAEVIGRSPAQVVLRWHLQRGDIVFPKSVSPQRIAENFAVFDFVLSADDVALIDALDQGASGRVGSNPDTFDVITR